MPPSTVNASARHSNPRSVARRRSRPSTRALNWLTGASAPANVRVQGAVSPSTVRRYTNALIGILTEERNRLYGTLLRATRGSGVFPIGRSSRSHYNTRNKLERIERRIRRLRGIANSSRSGAVPVTRSMLNEMMTNIMTRRN